MLIVLDAGGGGIRVSAGSELQGQRRKRQPPLFVFDVVFIGENISSCELIIIRPETERRDMEHWLQFQTTCTFRIELPSSATTIT